MKRYGIYIAYPPSIDLRDQGLGRYLASFLKGAERRDDVRFVLVCPSWSVGTLQKLLVSEGISEGHYKILAPKAIPWLLQLHSLLDRIARRERRRRGLLPKVMRAGFVRTANYIEDIFARAYGALGLAHLLLIVGGLAAIILIFLPVYIFLLLAFFLLFAARRTILVWFRRAQKLHLRAKEKIVAPQKQAMTLRLYGRMHEYEMMRLNEIVEQQPDMVAWYSPTAFWPSFHLLNVPTLTCVPDVVLMDFPVGFARYGDRIMNTFEQIERAIRTGRHFVTYSHDVKWNVAVKHFGVPASSVTVIPHAPNRLNDWVDVVGPGDTEAMSRKLCQSVLLDVIRRKSMNRQYSRGFAYREVRFLFYASQFRPNKNLMTLVKAYEDLLRRRKLPHKLFLTANQSNAPEVYEYILKQDLQDDILFLNGLSLIELAACYKLADLAICPTFSEGGCPFTFSEALSVGTPVLMSRIPVTMEVLTDPALQADMLFDPYDWQDISDKVVAVMDRRDELYARQKVVFDELSRRTWSEVVDEHLVTMDRISEEWRSGRSADSMQ